MASKRPRFGRIKVRLDELQQHGVVDFAKLLKASEPAEEPDADAGRRAPMQVGVVVLADEKPRGDSIPGEDMSDDEDNRGVGRKSRGGRGIFEDIIAKWSSLSVPDAGKDSDEGGDGSGGGASDDGDEAQDSDDYEYDDDLIDNSELEQKFTSRAIAKQKHKKQRTAGGSGFRIDNDEEDNDELAGDDEDDEDDEGDDETGEGDADGSTRAQDGKTGARTGGARPQGAKRRRRRQWLRDGEKNFKEVQAVDAAINDRLGIDGQKLTDGLNKENLQTIVEVFEMAEHHNCAADKLLEWISGKLGKTMQAVEVKIRKAFVMHKKTVQQEQALQKLDAMMRDWASAPSRGPLEVGSQSDPRSFAAMIHDLIEVTKLACPTAQKIKNGLGSLFKDVIRKVRICRDAQLRQNLEDHAQEQVLACGRLNLPEAVQQQELKDKIEQIRKSKLTPAMSQPGGGSGCGGGSAFAPSAAEGNRLPIKHNVFDAIPPSA